MKLSDIILEKKNDRDWYIDRSKVHGRGLFAGRDYKKNEILDVAIEKGNKGVWNLTKPGRYCNHQTKSNVDVVKKDDHFNFIANRPIKKDDEIYADYEKVTDSLGPDSRLQWKGRDFTYNSISNFTEKTD